MTKNLITKANLMSVSDQPVIKNKTVNNLVGFTTALGATMLSARSVLADPPGGQPPGQSLGDGLDAAGEAATEALMDVQKIIVRVGQLLIVIYLLWTLFSIITTKDEKKTAVGIKTLAKAIIGIIVIMMLPSILKWAVAFGNKVNKNTSPKNWMPLPT